MTPGYPGHPNFPEHHYRAAVLAADGEYSIERGSSAGDVGDFWALNMTLSADPDVWPNSASYQGGVVRPTGIEIMVRDDPAFIMSFQVSGLANQSLREKEFGATHVSPVDTETIEVTTVWILAVIGGIVTGFGIREALH